MGNSSAIRLPGVKSNQARATAATTEQWWPGPDRCAQFPGHAVKRDFQTEGIPMTNERLRRSVHEKADALERELDKALEDSFPASDPIAIDSADVHEERRRKAQQDSGSPFLPRSAVPK